MFDHLTDLEEESFKCESQPNEAKTAESQVQTQAYDFSALLKALEEEEKSLLQEKTELIAVEEQLKQKIKTEIAAKHQKIGELKGEIPGLKQRCEILATALGIRIEK